MRIPDKNWKYSEFIHYLLNNSRDVFGPKRRWLKMYYVYMDDHAKTNLMSLQPSRQGDLLKFEMGYKESASQKHTEVPYYMVEQEPGLFCFLTSSTREGYQKTLRRRVERTRGMSEMWIRPEVFEKVKDFIINEYGARIEGFLSTNYLSDGEEARIRPRVKRSIHYRGFDGIESIKELKVWYGVSPESIDFAIKEFKFQITNEGLITLKHPNELVYKIITEVLELIREEQIKQKDTALSLKFEMEQTDTVKTPYIESGKILLSTLKMDEADARLLINKFSSQFAFLDTYIVSGSLDFTATVIDRQKGSMFDISADENSIMLMPKFQTTYESFLNFYRKVVETFDRKAIFVHT